MTHLPPSSSTLTPEELRALLPSVVADITEQMFFGWAEACPASQLAQLVDQSGGNTAAPWLHAEVAFRGAFSGALRVTLPRELAQDLGAAMLGLTDDTPLEPQLLDDLAGELANMICGAGLTRGDRAHCFELLPPVIRNDAPGPSGAVDGLLFSVNERPLIVRLAVQAR